MNIVSGEFCLFGRKVYMFDVDVLDVVLDQVDLGFSVIQVYFIGNYGFSWFVCMEVFVCLQVKMSGVLLEQWV